MILSIFFVFEILTNPVLKFVLQLGHITSGEYLLAASFVESAISFSLVLLFLDMLSLEPGLEDFLDNLL